MGRGASNVAARIATSLGESSAVTPEFQNALDVPCAGVLFALPALLAVGLLDTAQDLLNPLPKGYYGLDSILLLLALMGTGSVEWDLRKFTLEFIRNLSYISIKSTS